ncbi:MAG TPA: hypothetical protein PLI19_00555 [Erysipelotrichaceae bacterium]|nr:hypothetical protein [Erysipelotrichaceae bacterium]HQB31795.1 hypothetical protein [Erysipelotrichaceae bacterium]
MTKGNGVYEEFSTDKGPYAGVWVIVLVLLLLPLFLYKVLLAVFTNFRAGNAFMIEYQAKIFAGLVSVLFDLTYILASGLQKPFAAVKKRIANFVGNLGYIGLRSSFKWYFAEAKETGYAFWIIFACILYNFYFFLDALVKLLNYINR